MIAKQHTPEVATGFEAGSKSTQHTPEPWRIGDAGRTVFGPPTALPSPVIIAVLPGETERVSAERREANARLISAAPDLLRACEAFVTWSNKSDICAAIGNGALLASAKAALAKAKGGAL